ncbi:GGDEF domain-containing protein [Pseudohongiella sp. SYSU M77423]|uniref:GGDEF domain-containing protein n=1 Tax=Pseudohongiella sp. SYSU M77423 TaxID=3042312 RepID=UPI0024815F27|nr:GGDEF domain-containing protein [Pseudohongiella sp. SYSU M77423]MDH7944857.1 GGDEF domain-containing protein [Pseudohongiella sp. SYSU M77423]
MLKQTGRFTGASRHQARLIYVVLTLMTLYFGVIGTLNVVVFQDYLVAALDYAGAVAVTAVLVYFHRSTQLAVASWLVVGVLIAVLLSFVHMADGRAYSLMWVTLLPPVTFFLLGRHAGAWICGLIFTYVCTFVYLRLPYWPPAEVTIGSLLNIIEVLTAHWFLFRLYERSRAEAFAELEHLSTTDPLTGLLNRSRLDSVLQEEINRHQRSGQPLSVVLCDLDHFKRINDNYGHLTGDQVLIETAALIRESMRKTDHSGRWGGEEFLLICPDTSTDATHTIIDKLRRATAGASLPHALQISLSFGIATWRASESSDQLLKRADDALYEAKRSGRDRIVLAPQ